MLTVVSQNFLLEWLPDFIGCSGALIVLVAYVLLQTQRLKAESMLFSLSNLGGGLMILISLFYAWNSAAVAVEIAWAIISLYGVIKALFPYGFTLRKKTILLP
jgi:hypothetical protein